MHSPDELKLIVTASRQFGEIPPFQEEMIHHALELDNITVREVMVPRPKIFSLPGDLTISDALARVVEEQHSRVPVYDPQRGPEHIVGVLYAKDLMRWTRLRLTATPDQPVAARVSAMKISQIMHDVLVVPETKVLTELLEEFKQRKRHLAVVVDEFGSTAGVITVEDVLEQIVGEIEDEFDIAPPQQALAEGQDRGRARRVGQHSRSGIAISAFAAARFRLRDPGRLHPRPPAKNSKTRRELRVRRPPLHRSGDRRPPHRQSENRKTGGQSPSPKPETENRELRTENWF